ncbi:MAG: methyl-accepting chemotaxis protein [Candidatus Thiodiazotropha taylori]|nr:methyl-accepting chemotaxis protein [Candidatus Thiodiazotropha taylori]
MSFLNNLSIKTRLSILVGILLLNTIFIGLLGLRGMQQADHAIDELYNVEMSHMLGLSTVIEKLEDSRAQILLALQHDPSSAFAKMHNHKVDMHTRKIEENIEIIDTRWEEFTRSHLDSEEQRLVETFTKELKHLEHDGLIPVDKLLLGGQFYEANQLLLTVINPALQKIQATTAELLKIQENKAAHAFEETHAAYQNMLSLVIGSLVIGALFAILLAYLIISEISKGVRQIEQSAHLLADGQLLTRVDNNNNDEIGHIATAFNRMAQQFHDAINQVKDSVVQLASAAEETSVVTNQTTVGINQQLNETSQVATAMNQMSSTVQEVARNAVDAANAAREADTTFIQGKTVIDQVIEGINSLANEVEQAATVIQELETESRNIGSVLDVIKSIAEQTNLLALNAAIEAARAGEQGRGFAVVADEVRTLAGRTQDSTQEIEEMISKLQEGADNAVKVMARGSEMTQSGVEQAASAGQALEKINTAMSEITEMNTQIASAAEEQSSVTEEINRSIVSINEVSEQSATGAQQTTQASGDVAKLAEQLKSLVERFKV